MGEQKHLDDRARCKHLHHGAARRLDIRSRFADLYSGDSFDLLPERRAESLNNWR